MRDYPTHPCSTCGKMTTRKTYCNVCLIAKRRAAIKPLFFGKEYHNYIFPNNGGRLFNV